MKSFRPVFNLIAVVVLTLTVNSLAQAQSSRTWVSGVGDDNNPCSRTAPCKTFSGALSKTLAEGEIDALDPGSFGAVTLNKSITIDGGTNFAGILALGTTGITVNAQDSDVVTIRNLNIDGAGTGLNGIRILSAGTVHVENVVIFGFRATSGTDAGRGIIDRRTVAGAKLAVSNTVLRNNIVHGIQIGIDTGFVSSVKAVLDNVRSVGNTLSGAFLGGGSKVSIRNSVMSLNGNTGVQVSEEAGGTTEAEITNTVLSHNTFGIFAGAGASLTRISDVTITDNTTGVSLNGGVVESFGNNNVRGNAGGNNGLTGVGQQ
jgi:Right handed beta helix region